MLSRLMGGDLTAAEFLTWLVAVAIAITVHEYAHAKRADMAGDRTPAQHGRLSLYPWAHYDPIGTTAFLLIGLGWAKPVPVNPAMFRNPRRDNIMVSLWGPLSNVLTAAAFGLPFRFLPADSPYLPVLAIIVTLNLALALFNLIPIHPLDGSHILLGLLPAKQARKLDAFYHQWGMLILILLLVSGRMGLPVLGFLIYGPLELLFGLFTGR